MQGLASAIRHQKLRLGIDVRAVIALELVRDRHTELRKTIGRRVDVLVRRGADGRPDMLRGTSRGEPMSRITRTPRARRLGTRPCRDRATSWDLFRHTA